MVRFRDIHKKPAFKVRKADDERAKTLEQITLERGILGEGATVINEDAEMLELLNSVSP